MIKYMKITPMRCPKCKKKILDMTNIIKNKDKYYGCPECEYFSKKSENFIDHQALKERN
jgi:transposase-like protein